MTTISGIPARLDGETSGPPDAVVQRTAFYFESRGEAIFAWLHQCVRSNPSPQPPARSGEGEPEVFLAPPYRFGQGGVGRGAFSCPHGVILCAPVGHEQVHAHRSLRHLADALARAGFAVLRFDYHGTGDSAGTDEDPERCATWLTNIRDARAWMQTQLGCRRFSLVGLRLGALLAA